MLRDTGFTVTLDSAETVPTYWTFVAERAEQLLAVSFQQSSLDEAKRNPGRGMEGVPDFIWATTDC
jgi:hypothetical protein